MSRELRVNHDLAIPGLAFRRFRGEEDFPIMVRIMTACNEIDRLEYNESVEDVAQVFEHLTNCDPSRDMLFAEIDGEPVAYSRVFWKDEQDGPRLYISLGFVVPAWRRRGLGTAILRWNEERARRIAAEHPAGIEKLHHVWTTDTEPGAMALFAAFEYRTVRTLIEMTRPTSEPLAACSMPEGLEVRPAEPEHFRAVWEAWEEAYADHWGYAPRTEDDYARWTTSRLFQPKLWKIAWAGDQVAGMVLNTIDERRNEWIGVRRGYTQDVFVRRPWRRRGLARSLLTESISMFARMGMEETYLGVDTESPSGADVLYASLGYRNSRRHLVYRKPLEGQPL
jgi:mycothiol synthase